jgi:signal transduction histidine kinase
LTEGLPDLWAEEPLLETVVTNLLENACKYSSSDSAIVIETRQQADLIGIAITDQGCGIAPEHQGFVFDEFFRVAPQSNIMGMGLGLAIVARIAQAHGGHVELTSQLGKGSCFCIWLPRLAIPPT